MDEFDYHEIDEEGENDNEAGAAEGAKKALQELAESSSNADSSKQTENINRVRDAINNSDRIKDIVWDKKISAEAFLSRTERMLLNNLDTALSKGDLSAVQEGLAAIGENPNSVKAIMNAMKERIQNANPNNSVKWETGTDSNGQSFVRLHITNSGKLSSTSVMVGSDGTHSATSSRPWDSSWGKPTDPAEALRDVMTRQWHHRTIDRIIIPDVIYKKHLENNSKK